MASRSLGNVLKELGQGHWLPVYLVSGNEPFQMEEFTRRLLRHFFPNGDRDGFNHSIFEADEVEPADFLAALDTLPGLFSTEESTRVVVVRRFEKASAALVEKLEAYLGDPAPGTCLLLLAEKADKRKGWVKVIDKSGGVLEVAEPYDRDWPQWRSFFERRCGKNIDLRAWEALVDAGGRTLALVAGECDKVSVYVGSRPSIERADVYQVCGASAVETVFELSEAIVGRQALQAALGMHQLGAVGESEIKILAIVLRHLRQIAECRRLQDQGIRDAKTLGPRIGVPPYFVPKIQRLAAGYTSKSLASALRLVARCDHRLKTGEGRLWADLLIPHCTQATV